MLKNNLLNKFKNKTIANTRESKILKNSLNQHNKKDINDQKMKNKLRNNNLTNVIISSKMFGKNLNVNLNVLDEKNSHNTSTLIKNFPIRLNNNTNKEINVSKELDLSKLKDKNLNPPRINIIPRSKLNSIHNLSTIQKINTNLNTNLNTKSTLRNIPAIPQIKKEILSKSKLMLGNPNKNKIIEKHESNNEIKSISIISNNKGVTSHFTIEKRITINKIQKSSKLENILSNMNSTIEKLPKNLNANFNANKQSSTNILRKEKSINFNNVINTNNSSFISKPNASYLKESRNMPNANQINNEDKVSTRNKLKNMTTNLNTNNNSMIFQKFPKKNFTNVASNTLKKKTKSKKILNASTNLNSNANLKTNLNSNLSVTISKNTKLQNQIRNNPQFFKSIQNLERENKLVPKNQRKDNFKTQIKDNSKSLEIIKAAYGNAKPIAPLNKKRNEPKRTYDQSNPIALGNLNKKNLKKNFSEVHQYKNLLLKNLNHPHIDLFSNSKRIQHELNNTISNASLGSFSLIHEKSEMNSNTKQADSSKSNSHIKSKLKSKSNSKEINVLEFVDIENLLEMEENKKKNPEAEIETDKGFYNNNDENGGEDKNVEEYYYDEQAEENVEEFCNEEPEQEDAEDEGVLTVDQVKDIIVYFDFDELDVEDQCLFYENDYKEFEFYQKYKYIKYFFNKKSVPMQNDDTSDVSPSTKDSSSYRQTLIPLITK